MLTTRERPRSPSARLLMPAPAALPSLTEALARRAEAFGPCDEGGLRPAPRGLLACLGGMLRGAADLLDPRVMPC